jgi:hypothetical protein
MTILYPSASVLVGELKSRIVPSDTALRCCVVDTKPLVLGAYCGGMVEVLGVGVN